MTSILTTQSRKPLALTIDDDPDFNKIMQLLLKRLGMEVKTTNSPKEFLTELKSKRPDLCLLDLTIGNLDAGYALVKAVRSVLGPDLPLIVVSQSSDRRSIAHALEIGANDFIVKPVEQELLAAKLKNYIDTDALAAVAPEMVTIPDGDGRAYVSIDVNVIEVDELGLKLSCPYLVSKGTALYVDHPFIHGLTGKSHPVLMTVTSTWVESSNGPFGAYVEFDEVDENLRAAVRRWIASNVRTGTTPSPRQALED